jgi:hypothetical protein
VCGFEQKIFLSCTSCSKNNEGSILNVGYMWVKQATKAAPSSAYSMQKIRVTLFDSALGGLNVILVQVFLRRNSRFFH